MIHFASIFSAKNLKTLILMLVLSMNVLVFAANDAPPSFTIKTTPTVNVEEVKQIETVIPSSNPFGGSNDAIMPLVQPNPGSSIELQTIDEEINPTDLSILESKDKIEFEVVPRVENLNLKVKNENSVEISFQEIPGVDTYFVLYGTKSVVSEDDIYNMPPVDTDGQASYVITDLEENVDYFFSVVAKANQDYSEFLSDEASIKIDASLLNFPEITEAKAINDRNLEVKFSQDMNFENIETLKTTLSSTFDNTELTIKSLNNLDSKTLNIKTQNLKSGFEYILNIENLKSLEGLELKDNSSNYTFRTQEVAVLEDLNVENIEVFDYKGIELTFNDSIVDFESLKEKLNIVEKANPNNIMEIEEVLANPSFETKLLIVVKGLSEVEYQIILGEIEGFEKGGVAITNKTLEFMGVNPPQTQEENSEIDTKEPTELSDTKSPEDVRNLEARFIDEALKTLEISFEPSLDLDNDLAKYEVYFAKDSDNYFSFMEVSKDQTDPVLVQDLDLNAEFYNVKVTAIDNKNNESLGAVFKLYLPETGPAGTLALFGLSIFGSRRLTRKEN